MKEIIKSSLTDIEEIVKLIDAISETVFSKLLKECDNLYELETRLYQRDKYLELSVETEKICQMVASRVRKMATAYVENEKSQHKIVLGE